MTEPHGRRRSDWSKVVTSRDLHAELDKLRAEFVAAMANMVEYARPAIAYMDGHLTRAEFVLLIDLVQLKKKARA